MAKLSKRVQALRAKVDRNQAYPVADALRIRQACLAALDDHAVGHDEGGVEAHAELADEL